MKPLNRGRSNKKYLQRTCEDVKNNVKYMCSPYTAVYVPWTMGCKLILF